MEGRVCSVVFYDFMRSTVRYKYIGTWKTGMMRLDGVEGDRDQFLSQSIGRLVGIYIHISGLIL